MADNNELEKTLWVAADKMRFNMDAVEYEHVALDPTFPKYISDAFNAPEFTAYIELFESAIVSMRFVD